ncbi:MAG TPA: hypothetical protein VNR70_06290 [Steroidobacteraceae bacterium]|jgi:hypothetical protein|nr:hypothetical protein [Steroidobacteraceae bacterium]
MEWVLQLVDEIDDAIGAARHGWLGINAQMNVLLGGVAAAAGGMLRMRGSRLRTRS